MSYTAIDLSQLPAPDVVETLDYENILAAMLEDLQQRDPVFNALVESDPVYKILEVAAYRETIIRQRVNDAARAVMLAYATGPDLDQLGALFNVERKLLTPADPTANPPIEAVWESDEEFRRRIQLSLEGLSVAGPEGAYIFHSLSADPRVQDATATSPAPGEVLVTILSREGDGSAPADLVKSVDKHLQQDDLRPLTDSVTVQGAEIVRYDIRATIYTYPGPDRAVVLAEARKALDLYVDEMRRLHKAIPRTGITAALHVEGVQRVELASPAADLAISATQAGYCRSIRIIDGGTAF
ncbi:baseplate assembly protein [Endozoicomonas acroporae]|uniref:baseplate assembly protein n=1 Tax=Endozoicomonas acroporae TaxID=1701104 RepID=UPI0013D820B4|nr:baseplate J/gp47 family protein [Endozoicomonas acroporae]